MDTAAELDRAFDTAGAEHAGSQAGEVLRAAAAAGAERQFRKCVDGHFGAGGALLGLQDGRGCFDVDGLRGIANLEGEVEARDVADVHHDVLPRERLEPVLHHLHAIRAGRQGGDAVNTGLGRFRHAGDARLGVPGSDDGAWDDGAAGIRDGAANCAAVRLGADAGCDQQQDTEREQASSRIGHDGFISLPQRSIRRDPLREL